MPLRLATFNTNSVRARLSIILDWLAREKPDVLCLQETKAQDKDFPASDFDSLGYHVAFRGQKSYNGVAVVSRHPLENIRKNLYDRKNEEARFISAEIRGIPILNVYVPQGVAPGTEKFEYKLQWVEDLLTHVQGQYDPQSPLILTGDLNVALEPVDVYDPETLQGEVGFHPDEQAVLRKFLDWGLVDIFRKHEPDGGNYTFWDYRIPNALKRKMGWRIDYILATEPLAKTSAKAWIDTQARTLSKPSDHTFLNAEFEY